MSDFDCGCCASPAGLAPNAPKGCLRAAYAGVIARLKGKIDTRLNDCLCEMKEGYDDSIVGFNEAWDIMRKIFEEEARRMGSA